MWNRSYTDQWIVDPAYAPDAISPDQLWEVQDDIRNKQKTVAHIKSYLNDDRAKIKKSIEATYRQDEYSVVRIRGCYRPCPMHAHPPGSQEPYTCWLSNTAASDKIGDGSYELYPSRNPNTQSYGIEADSDSGCESE